MPFGLSNATATFQATTNQLFKPFLRKFFIVFFGDVLIYTPTLDSRLQQLPQACTYLAKEKLFKKLSKRLFIQESIDYLDQIISFHSTH